MSSLKNLHNFSQHASIAMAPQKAAAYQPSAAGNNSKPFVARFNVMDIVDGVTPS